MQQYPKIWAQKTVSFVFKENYQHKLVNTTSFQLKLLLSQVISDFRIK